MFVTIPLIVREIGSGTRQVLAKYVPADLIAFEFGSSEAIKQAVRCDLIISLLSREILAEDGWTYIETFGQPDITWAVILIDSLS